MRRFRNSIYRGKVSLAAAFVRLAARVTIATTLVILEVSEDS
jgi:hypothetical protein